MTARPRGRRWWPRSLRRQLALGVSLIVTVALVGIGIAAELALRNEMVALANSQVANSLAAFDYSVGKAKKVGAAGPGPMELGSLTGQAPGTVVALLRDDRVVYARVFDEREPVPARADVSAALESIVWSDGDPREVRLAGLGSYQAGTLDIGGGERLVSAVSLREANRTLTRNLLIVAALVGIALLAAAAATATLVRKALQPLRRVAAISAHVAKLPLEAAEYRITARVGDRDTDPRSEVGTVALTLNQMLDNVDTALTLRARADQRMRQFLTDASHELRTPLAAILGYAELTRQEAEQLPPMTEYALGRIESESRRMSTLVSDLLLLARLDEGQDLRIEDVDLAELVADAVNDAAVSAPDHHFVGDVPPSAVRVPGDRARLQQTVANLLGNARMHAPPGTTVTTSLALQVEAGRPVAVLEVSDDGPGIPAEIMPNLFGRFVRADKARSREMGSSGLGLAIVAAIVEAHHGTVGATSRPGRTVFTVRIPVEDVDTL